MKSQTNLCLLTAARDAWLSASSLRSRRERYKRYTYGDQWSDIVTDESGRRVRESDQIEDSGRKPLINNMIRQIVKIVIGRYRSSSREEGIYRVDSPRRSYITDNALLELDCRMLEEFLISGCAVQRVCRETRQGRRRLWIDNVNPRKFFVNAFRDPRGCDIEMIGMLHDLSFPEIIARFAGDSSRRFDQLAHIYSSSSAGSVLDGAPQLGESDDSAADFFTAPPGRCRAIEVWTLDCRNTLLCHDRRDARAYTLNNSAAARETIDNLNSRRISWGEATVATRRRLDFVWHCRWFAPDGSLLASYDSPFRHGSHPFAVKFYPLTDGEVHSFVEDVIDQQRCINRMVVLIDHIIGSAAKGLLLFPQEQKPKNYDWSDIRDAWSRANGVIPITGHGNILPQQVHSPTDNKGASELLNLQMKLFDQISGVSDVIAGRSISPSTGNAVYESQLRNSAVALADLIDSFAAFRSDRDYKAINI
ncbi:MAG: hypothetical protein K2J10_11765 [Muribaculaceae bacterium]|nr:hypothetical protein [Muribaculaceae bacterium]